MSGTVEQVLLDQQSQECCSSHVLNLSANPSSSYTLTNYWQSSPLDSLKLHEISWNLLHELLWLLLEDLQTPFADDCKAINFWSFNQKVFSKYLHRMMSKFEQRGHKNWTIYDGSHTKKLYHIATAKSSPLNKLLSPSSNFNVCLHELHKVQPVYSVKYQCLLTC